MQLIEHPGSQSQYVMKWINGINFNKDFLSTRSYLTWSEYKQQRNCVVSLQQKAKNEYFQRLLSKGT